MSPMVAVLVMAVGAPALADDDPALVATPDNFTTPVGRQLSFDPLVNDVHADGTTLTVGSLTAPGHGTATVDGSVVTYTPQSGFDGVDAFQYTVTDGAGHNATGTVTMTVAAVNLPPLATDDVVSVAAGGTEDAHTITVLANDTDPDGDALTIVEVGAPSNGAVATVDGGAIRVSNLPTGGVTTFTYSITDGHGGYSTANVMVGSAAQ